MLDARKNLVWSTVLTAPSPATSGTSLTVQAADAAIFDAIALLGYCNAIVHSPTAKPKASNSEYVRITASSSGVLTIIRTQEGSSARSIATGDIIAVVPSSKMYDDIENTLNLSTLERQLVINGNFDIWQRNTTFTQNDDLYIADRWIGLQEANSSWIFSRESTIVPTNSNYSLKCLNSTANNQAAIVQILEGADTAKIAGKNISLSFQARTTSGLISKLRATVLSWTGTKDVVTSDVIATWNQNGTDPTWAANWTSEVAGTDLTLTNSFQTFKVENIAIDTANVKNIAIVIWVDDGTIASSDVFYISQVQVNVGSTVLPFQSDTFSNQLTKCMRFYEKSYNYDVFPGTNTTAGCYWFQGTVNGSGDFVGFLNFLVKKRVSPTMSHWKNDGTSGSWVYTNSGGSGTGNPVDARAGVVAENNYVPYFTAGGSWSAVLVLGQWVADAEL